jgi:hypothetical protein
MMIRDQAQLQNERQESSMLVSGGAAEKGDYFLVRRAAAAAGRPAGVSHSTCVAIEGREGRRTGSGRPDASVVRNRYYHRARRRAALVLRRQTVESRNGRNAIGIHAEMAPPRPDPVARLCCTCRQTTTETKTRIKLTPHNLMETSNCQNVWLSFLSFFLSFRNARTQDGLNERARPSMSQQASGTHQHSS